MDKSEMMIVCEIADPGLRDKLLELYKRDIPAEPIHDELCPNCNTCLVDDNGVWGEFCPNCGQRININGKPN